MVSVVEIFIWIVHRTWINWIVFSCQPSEPGGHRSPVRFECAAVLSSGERSTPLMISANGYVVKEISWSSTLNHVLPPCDVSPDRDVSATFVHILSIGWEYSVHAMILCLYIWGNPWLTNLHFHHILLRWQRSCRSSDVDGPIAWRKNNWQALETSRRITIGMFWKHRGHQVKRVRFSKNFPLREWKIKKGGCSWLASRTMGSDNTNGVQIRQDLDHRYKWR